MQSRLTPYLNFNGKTGEAMDFYHAIFGGQYFKQTFGEAGMAKEPEHEHLIMHASINADDIKLMASDGRPGTEVVFGDSVSLSLGGTDQEQLTGYFNKLAEGGTITMPLEKQFWGDIFGMLTDKFGIHWMVDIADGEKRFVEK